MDAERLLQEHQQQIATAAERDKLRAINAHLIVTLEKIAYNDMSPNAVKILARITLVRLAERS